MKLSLRITLFVLFLLPLISLFYKNTFLGLSLLPKEVSDEWSFEFKVDDSAYSSGLNFTYPLPVSSSLQDINNLKLSIPDNVETKDIKEEGSSFIVLKRDDTDKKISFSYEFRAKILEDKQVFPKKISSNNIPQKLRKYLSTELELSNEDTDALSDLTNVIVDPNADKLTSLKKIFFYVSEEIRLSQNTQSISESLSLGLGSTYTKALIFTYLTRASGIPSRIGAAIKLEPDPTQRPNKNQYRFFYFSEVYLNGNWYQINHQKTALEGLPKHTLVVTRDIHQLDLSYRSLQNFSVFALPLKTNRFDTKIYSDELKRSDSIFYNFSLYSLPLSSQTSMYIILLLPIGAVMISFFRNIIGFSTFGIFTPALITIFFIETEFVFAFIFFVLVIFLGFFQRVLLDKLYLLAVPRISILLTFVIIAYMLFVLINQNILVYTFQGSGMLSYFPVVIITILIERFSIDFIEEGTWNTFKKLAGTVTISIVCYFILTFHILQQLLFTNPEFLLWTIALNIIIGNYKGYRVSEFFRFRELSKQITA